MSKKQRPKPDKVEFDRERSPGKQSGYYYSRIDKLPSKSKTSGSSGWVKRDSTSGKFSNESSRKPSAWKGVKKEK